MIAKVIKQIPGRGYAKGDHARFDQSDYAELRKKGYLLELNEDIKPQVAKKKIIKTR